MTRVRGDLEPPSQSGIYPQGVPSDLASLANSGVHPQGVPQGSSRAAGGKIGLVAPLTGVADSSPVADFDPSGPVRAGPACHSIASQSGNQSDSQSNAQAPAHTAQPESIERKQNQSSVSHRRLGRVHASRDEVNPRADSSVDHSSRPQPAFQFQLASSVPTFHWRAP